MVCRQHQISVDNYNFDSQFHSKGVGVTDETCCKQTDTRPLDLLAVFAKCKHCFFLRQEI